MRNTKRFLPCLLAAAMVMTSISPAAVMADPNPTVEESSVENSDIEGGNTENSLNKSESDADNANEAETLSVPQILAPSVAVTDITETGASLTIEKQGNTAADYYYPLYVIREKSEVTEPIEVKSGVSGVTMIQDADFLQGNSTKATQVFDELKENTEYVIFAAVSYYTSGTAPVYSDTVSAEFKTEGSGMNEDPLEGEVSKENAVLTLSYKQNNEVQDHYFAKGSDLSNALDKIEDSCGDITITLEKDLKESINESWGSVLTIHKTCTLDLNGNTITADPVNKYLDQSRAILVEGDITFTLKDSSEGKGQIVSKGNIIEIGSCLLRATPSDVHFVMENGTLNCTGSGTALFIADFAKADIKNGIVSGYVCVNGACTIENGTFESDKFEYILGLHNEASLLTVKGGTFRNNKSTSSASVVGISKYSDWSENSPRIQLLGGVFKAVNGAALRYDHNGINDNILISGNAQLSSENGPAVYINAINMQNKECATKITIEGGAELRGADGAIKLESVNNKKSFSKWVKGVAIYLNEGCYLQYGDSLPVVPDSSYVTYPEGMILGDKPVTEGEHAGFYTLEKVSSARSLDALKTAINGAVEIYETGNEEGTYDDTLWTSFKDAYEAALSALENANANQIEIDYLEEQLNKSLSEIKKHAESDIDLSKLEDGTYAVDLEMWYWTANGEFTQYSMSNNAIDHSAKLVVKDGDPYLTAKFKPISIGTAYGALMYYWVYDYKTPEEAFAAGMGDQSGLTEVSYPSFMLVDNEKETVSSIAGIPSEKPALDNGIRPAEISFKLPYIGASNKYNRIYCRVAVDAMRNLAGGTEAGDQNVIMYIKYNTLKKLSDEEASRADLENAINNAKSVTNDNGTYTAESFKALTDAIAEAEALIQSGTATEEELKAAQTKIEKAHSGLVKAENDGGNGNSGNDSGTSGSGTGSKEPGSGTGKADTAKTGTVIQVGKTYTVDGQDYQVTKAASGTTAGTVTFTKAKNAKKITVPDTVKLADGKTYKVTAVGAKAFTAKKIRTVTVGANVTKLAKKAFAKSKAKKVILKTKSLKKASVKGSLKGSKVKKIQVKVGAKKVNKKFAKKYKKFFTKKNAGKKATVK